MMSTRRKSLASFDLINAPNAHAELWLDKYVADQNEPNYQSRFIAEVSRLATPEVYKEFYKKRWLQILDSQGAIKRTAHVKGRMIVGLGDESILETAITLHRTYGVPYIPGSALKGLAASYARQRLGKAWNKDSEAYKTVFGKNDDTGYITFFDALYIPETESNQPVLHPDVITVHHQKYYQGITDSPADWDDPIPVPFLTATGNYLIALAGPEIQEQDTWIEKTFTILRYALAEMGIGAKTSSGYGRLALAEDTET